MKTDDLDDLVMQKVYLQERCAKHRKAVEFALEWLKEFEHIHPATTITNLSEASLWAKLREYKNDKASRKTQPENNDS